jgi:CelD/BcsL family acetyltransferase involved in cellulose biosynthesis
VEFETLNSEGQFMALGPGWNSLLEASKTDSVFSTFEWLSTWWRHFGQGQQLNLITARRDGRLVGIAPFVISQREGFKQAALMGGYVTDYKDFIVDEHEDRPAVLESMLVHLFERAPIDLLQVNGLRADACTLAALNEILPRLRAWRPALHSYAVAPYIPIGESWAGYWAGLSSEFRRTSKQRIARLTNASNSVRFGGLADRDDVQSFMSALFEHKIARWREAQRNDLTLQQPAVQGFYRALALRMFDAGWLRMCELQVENKVAAIDLGIEYGGKYYSCQHTLNYEFEAYSAGRLLTLHILEDAFARHLREVDLLVGDGTHKRDYRPQRRELFTLSMFQKSMRGRAAATWFRHVRPRLAQTVQGSKLLSPLGRWVRRRLGEG